MGGNLGMIYPLESILKAVRLFLLHGLNLMNYGLLNHWN